MYDFYGEGKRVERSSPITYSATFLDKFDEHFYLESWTKRKENRMSKFKIGDHVRLVKSDDHYSSRIGDTGVVMAVRYDVIIEVRVDRLGYMYQWHEKHAELIKETNDFKEKKMRTTKYYRVTKEHPLFEVGAILSNTDNEDRYKPIDSVFYKDVQGMEDIETYYEGKALIEHQTEWFGRVYPIGKLEKMAFGNKKQAQAAAAAVYKDEK